VPSNLILIAALSQSIENELAWWRIEPKILQYSTAFISRVSITAPLWK